MKEETPKAADRNNKRIKIALPVRVTYWDNEIRPQLEMGCTYDISARGARVTGLRFTMAPGEIVAVERGRIKTYCRVAWVGDANSQLRGQVGVHSIETDKTLWEAELRNMEQIYDPITPEGALYRSNPSASSLSSNRRRYQRFMIEGVAELLDRGAEGSSQKAEVKDLSEFGCLVVTDPPLVAGTDLKLVLKVANQDLCLKGRVRHADATGLGIEFREIRKGDRQLLQYLLKKLAEQQEQEERKANSAAASR
jgi:hypothetical protein